MTHTAAGYEDRRSKQHEVSLRSYSEEVNHRCCANAWGQVALVTSTGTEPPGSYQ